MIGALLVVPERRSLPLSMLEFAAWLVVAFVAFADIWVQAGLTGASFGAALNGRYGILHLTLTIAALLAVVALSRGRRQWELLVTAAVVALLSESLAGHAATGALPVAGALSDSAHLLAAATWIGVLLTTLIAPDSVDVQRTSNVATYAVVVLLASAVVQVLRNVSSWNALVTTASGLEVCAKMVLFAVVAAIALRSRRRVSAGTAAVLPDGALRSTRANGRDRRYRVPRRRSAPALARHVRGGSAEREDVGQNSRRATAAGTGAPVHRAGDALRAPHARFVRCEQMTAFRATSFVNTHSRTIRHID